MSTEKTLVELMLLCSKSDGISCDVCPVKNECYKWWDNIDLENTPKQILILEFQTLRGRKRMAKGGTNDTMFNLS